MMALKSTYYTILHIFTIATFTQCAQIPPTSKPTSNHIIKEPTVKIQCLSGSMLITIKDAPTHDGAFSGMIYPKGLSKNSTCLSEYREQEGPLKYKLPLRSCNTMPQETDEGGIEFFNTIVLQPHLKLVTDLGRGYHVRCRYRSREAAAGQKKAFLKAGSPQALIGSNETDRREHGRALDKSSSANTIPMPGCHMKIFTGEKLAENVKIGDPLTLSISLDKQELYGLHITDCIVRDGLGWGEQTLVNNEGCPLDPEIMGPFNYTDGQNKASVTFPAHKFPYTTSVYYQCNVKLCALVDPECHKTPTCAGKRIKRQAESADDDGSPATIEVYSGLYVNENAEVLDDDADSVFREKTPDDAICVSQRSFAIAISIAGLILMLLVVLAVLCIMARRRGKTVSNSGSSIYSGPYTNTAFSHSS